MSDVIKRSAAIKAIEELPNAYNGWSDAYDKAYIIDTLEEVPKADRPQGEWIPCSERLPSEQGQYLVTFPLCNGDPWVYVLSFSKGKFYETDDEWGDVEYDDVTAWMPLPKPYTADTPQTDAEIPKNALRSDCTGCRFVGAYDTEFPCANCVRKNKDYYDPE